MVSAIQIFKLEGKKEMTIKVGINGFAVSAAWFFALP